jgi:hypothetical protein
MAEARFGAPAAALTSMAAASNDTVRMTFLRFWTLGTLCER